MGSLCSILLVIVLFLGLNGLNDWLTTHIPNLSQASKSTLVKLKK